MIKKVEVILFNNALPLDVTGPTTVLSTASKLLQAEGVECGYQLNYTGLDIGRVNLDGDFPMLVDNRIGEIGDVDMLLVPGGLGVDAFIDTQGAVETVANAAKKATRIVSVCTGAGILAAAGLLNGRKASTHWRSTEKFINAYPEVCFDTDALYQKDGNIYTSAGVTTGIDLALSIVEEDWGRDLAMQVARILVVYYHRPGWQTQFSPPLEVQANSKGRFAALHEWVLEHLMYKLSVEELADEAGMSPRNFARVFTMETGMTPAKYVEGVRLEHVRTLLEAGECDFDHVASASGFKREERMRKAFKRKFGISPREYISHFAVTEEK